MLPAYAGRVMSDDEIVQKMGRGPFHGSAVSGMGEWGKHGKPLPLFRDGYVCAVLRPASCWMRSSLDQRYQSFVSDRSPLCHSFVVICECAGLKLLPEARQPENTSPPSPFISLLHTFVLSRTDMNAFNSRLSSIKKLSKSRLVPFPHSHLQPPQSTMISE